MNIRNITTNEPIKNDKWAGSYEIIAVYPRACAFQLSEIMNIFPVFHISLFLSLHPDSDLPDQKFINEAESKNTKERILIRENGEKKGKKTWEFNEILNVYNQNEYYYCIQWKHHAPIWQPAKNLKVKTRQLWPSTGLTPINAHFQIGYEKTPDDSDALLRN
jgi:hypothetical protein